MSAIWIDGKVVGECVKQNNISQFVTPYNYMRVDAGELVVDLWYLDNNKTYPKEYHNFVVNGFVEYCKVHKKVPSSFSDVWALRR